MINSQTNKYEFKVYRKPAISNVQIKPNSNIYSAITIGIFKGFLLRAFNECSQKYFDAEITFLNDIFTENGHLS